MSYIFKKDRLQASVEWFEVSIAFFSYNLKRTISILGVENFMGYLVNPNIMKVS